MRREIVCTEIDGTDAQILEGLGWPEIVLDPGADVTGPVAVEEVQGKLGGFCAGVEVM